MKTATTILTGLFIVTVVEPLSAFLMLITGLSHSSLIALISLPDRLFLGLEIPVSASCNLTIVARLFVQ